MAFIHVEDAAHALLAAAVESRSTWQVFNAAPEVATIGQLARTVQKLSQERGAWVRIEGVASTKAGFQVSSRLEFTPRHTLDAGLREVLDHFLQVSRE